MRINKISYFFHKIVCKFTSNPAIQAMGLIRGIKYNLGIAKEGVDFY